MRRTADHHSFHLRFWEGFLSPHAFRTFFLVPRDFSRLLVSQTLFFYCLWTQLFAGCWTSARLYFWETLFFLYPVMKQHATRPCVCWWEGVRCRFWNQQMFECGNAVGCLIGKTHQHQGCSTRLISDGRFYIQSSKETVSGVKVGLVWTGSWRIRI